MPITIDASWANLGPGVLGSARPGSFFSDFAGAPDQTLWYPSALANALAGKDLDPANPEISAKFSSNGAWYYGTDGQTPSGRYDLETAVLHELGHGLGFLSSDSYDPQTGMGLLDEPTPFDAFIRTPDGRRLSDIPNPSVELGTLLTSPLTWSGANGVAANNGVRPQIYAPSTYEDGSSVSHLDELTYPSGTPNTLMTPQLDPGEAIHDPGPITLGMLADMRTKPPAGPVTSLPSAPLNPVALVGDASALVTFDPPVDARLTQVTGYLVTVTPGGFQSQSDASPIKITGLRTGVSYTFAISAINSMGTGQAVFTNPVVPQPSWKSAIVDRNATPDFVTAVTFRKAVTAIYADSVSGDLKRATLVGTKWRSETVDGASMSGGRTTHNLDGALSTCVSGTGTKQLLHVFYTDTQNKDLRHATYDGKKWKFEVVDGNGPLVQAVDDPNRVRTASDVSVSNACVATADGVQVFYRDNTQGILLGAVLIGNSWRYEVVDGDRLTGNRTTGDVGFHLAAIASGRAVHVFYDSVLKIDRDRNPTTGEMREAVRSSKNPTDWVYRTIDGTSPIYPVSGYGAALTLVSGHVYGAWLSAPNSGLGTPTANTIDWANLSTSNPLPLRIASGSYGVPSQPLALNAKTLLYGCQGRLCAIDIATGRQSLVSGADVNAEQSAAFVTVAGKTGVLVGINHSLRFLKP
ncbi:hypothetical protein GALL_444950 [mine drainage metagenome]|uniref:Fibronectin type-III domain-containing protein n=1 Tax=mine drainage metagenome TaxID=410659 RepID=A0A1J5Q1H2_9ZZZZ